MGLVGAPLLIEFGQQSCVHFRQPRAAFNLHGPRSGGGRAIVTVRRLCEQRLELFPFQFLVAMQHGEGKLDADDGEQIPAVSAGLNGAAVVSHRLF